MRFTFVVGLLVVLVALLGAGCGTVPMSGPLVFDDPCQPVQVATMSGFIIGGLAASPATIALWPITIPLAKAADSFGLGLDWYAVALGPSMVGGGIVGAALGLPAWLISLPFRDAFPNSRRSRLRRLDAYLESCEWRVPRDELLIALLRREDDREDAILMLQGRKSATPLLLRALDEPRLAPHARRALEGAEHRRDPLARRFVRVAP